MLNCATRLEAKLIKQPYHFFHVQGVDEVERIELRLLRHIGPVDELLNLSDQHWNHIAVFLVQSENKT